MAGPGPQTPERCQAWFGPAYVAKVAAQAGYPWQAIAAENDVHVLHGLAIVLTRFPALDAAQREVRVQWWAVKMLRTMGIALR